MVTDRDIASQTERLRAGLEKAYNVRGASLADALQRAGRRVPARVQRRVQPILAAEAMGGNPRLLQRIDRKALRAGERALIQHLSTVDRAAARRAAVTDWGSRLGVSIFLVIGGVVAWLILSGQV